MPTYEFKCKDCEKIFFLQQTFQEHEKNPRPACPHCKSKKTEQLFSAVSVITSKKS